MPTRRKTETETIFQNQNYYKKMGDEKKMLRFPVIVGMMTFTDGNAEIVFSNPNLFFWLDQLD